MRPGPGPDWSRRTYVMFVPGTSFSHDQINKLPELVEGLGDPLFAKVVSCNWHDQLATSIGHVALRAYFALCLWSENQ